MPVSVPGRPPAVDAARPRSIQASMKRFDGRPETATVATYALVHGWRRAVVDLFRVSPITRRCRPVEPSVSGGAVQVVGLVPDWRPVRRPRAASSRGGLVGRGVGTGPASSSGG